MIPFDWSVGFVTGQTLAYAAKKELATENKRLVNRPFVISLLWMALVYAPSAMFFYHGWTAWNSVYVLKDVPAGTGSSEYPDFESRRLLYESILIWIDCTALIGIFIGGFVLAHRWIARGNQRNILIACVTVTVMLLAYLGLTYARSFFVTTYEHFDELKRQGVTMGDVFTWKGKDGSTFLGHSVFWSNVVIFFVDFGPLTFLYWKFRKDAPSRLAPVATVERR